MCCLFSESIYRCSCRAQRHSIRKMSFECGHLPLVQSHRTFPWKRALSPGSSWMLCTRPNDISRDTENLDSVQRSNHGRMHRWSSNLQVQDSYNCHWCDGISWCIRSARCHSFLQFVEDKCHEMRTSWFSILLRGITILLTCVHLNQHLQWFRFRPFGIQQIR